MSDSDFRTVIGLEIHTQLKTKSKMFCGCSNDAEGKSPNSTVCPVCMGMPGTLPVANVEALKLTAKIGLALGSEIAKISCFDRKHYFYPDLPKGYQISQYQNPFCIGGSLTVADQEIKFNRVHLEEDAGKLVHHSDVSYVDLNRAGTPLAEIVTEPVISSPAQAKEFLKELRELLRAIGASDADMEKGHFRCDANISITKDGKSSPIIEIKNLNSFKFVEKALAFEEKRLRDDFDSWPKGQTKTTRGFNSVKGVTYTLREKEEAKDYRYFPEPDIPPIELDKLFNLEKLKEEMNNLPQDTRDELETLGLSGSEVAIVLKNPNINSLVEQAEEADKVAIGKLLINNPEARQLNSDQLKQIVDFIKKGHPSNWVRSLIKDAVEKDKLPTEIIDEIQLNSIECEDTSNLISEFVDQLFKENPKEAERFKSGDKALVNFFIGQAMKITKGSVNPKEITDELMKRLEE